MKCPVDQHVFKEFPLQSTAIDVCPQCAGIWFSATEFESLVRTFVQGEQLELLPFHKKTHPEPPRHYWQESPLHCPAGHGVMKKHDYAGDSKIHIDQCWTCDGFWLDGGDVIRLWEYCKPNQGEAVLGKFMIQSMNDAEVAKGEIASFVAGLGAVSSLQEFGLFLVRTMVNEFLERMQGKAER